MTATPCSACGEQHLKLSRGMCKRCYNRWLKAEKAAGTYRRLEPPSIADRMKAQSVASGDGCLLWTGSVGQLGYGRMSVNGTQQLAHRLAYELEYGPIPEKAVLDHVCHNRDLSCAGGSSCRHRRCVNPEHLEPVQILENIRRSPLTPYGKAPKTECIRGHRLTDETVYKKADGRRVCKQCLSDWQKRKYAEQHPKTVRETCRRGHRLTAENTYLYGNRRVCRECQRAAQRAIYWRNRGRAT